MDFFATARYQMKVGVPGVDGAVIFPSGIALPTLERRDLEDYDHMSRVLLDPQLYLSGLDVSKAERACANLASYGWFDGTTPDYNSSKQKQNAWKSEAVTAVRSSWTGVVPTEANTIADRVRLCIDIQERIGCEALILPSPLISTSDDLQQQLAWLDTGLQLAARIAPGKQRLATIAIADTVLRNIDPWTSRFLDALLDQVSARGPEGAYLVIEQASYDGMFETNQNVLGTLVRLARDLRVADVERVVVPLAGVAGLLAAAVGAQTWATGFWRGDRRLRLSDFEETDEVRRAMPLYYSHRLAGEIHLKNDLDTINANRLLEQVADTTQASEGLLRALRAGRTVAEVPEWEARTSNTHAARAHLAMAMVRETVGIRALPLKQRLDTAKRWLDNAINVAQKISSLGDFHHRTTLGHQRAWRSVLEAASRTA